MNANLIFGLYNLGDDSRKYVNDFMDRLGEELRAASGKVRIDKLEKCRRVRSATTCHADKSTVTNMSSMLHNIRTSYVPSPFQKVESDTFVVLLISGKIYDIRKATIEAMRLKHRVTVIVIGVDNSVNREQLKRLASYRMRSKPDLSHLLPIDSPNVLPKIVKKVHALMCSRQ